MTLLRWLGRADYEATWAAMRALTEARGEAAPDELWFLEHPPVFTLGMAGRREHLLAAGDIPVVATDRGGQVTYHGPGQLVVYPLLNLRRLGLGVRALVERLERSVCRLVAESGIEACSRREAPGVYVGDRKLASLGLRVRRGCSYHGLALNVDLDLEPFARINPCGYAGLAMTRLVDLGIELDVPDAAMRLLPCLVEELGLSTPATWQGRPPVIPGKR